MDRKNKIALLQSLVVGTITPADVRKQIAIAKGWFNILVGLDFKEYIEGRFPIIDLIFFNGKPYKISAGPQVITEETYE